MSVYAEIWEDDPSKIIIREFDWRYKDLIMSVPSASFKKDYFLVSKDWPSMLALKYSLHRWLTISDELKEWVNNHFNEVINPAYTLRSVVASDEGNPLFYPHQRVDIKFLSTARRAILSNDLGSGKTFSASGTIRNLHEEGEDVFPLLVVCPNSTKISWSRDFNTAFPGRKITVIDGTATQRRKQFKQFKEDDGDVLIMNWDSIRHHSKLLHFGGTALKRCTECKGVDETVKVTACEAHTKELNEIEFKSVIGDEIHRISDPSTKVSRAFKAATGDADIRIALSGTPINSTPDQLFSALNWLYPKAYPSKVRFIDRFCDTAQNQWGGATVLGIKKDMEQEFFQGIDPILRRMPKDVILPYLPPVVRVQRDVEMAAKQKKAYEQMKELMVAEYENGEIVRAKSPLSKLLRLSQLASAYGEIELKEVPDPNSPIPGTLRTEEIVTMADPSAKLDAFIDDLPDYGDSSVVVFAHHKQLIHLLAKRFDKMGIEYGLITGDQDLYERQAYMDSFQNGHIKYILVTLQAGGTGITLTKADTMVFLQRSYSMIDNIQAEGRGHRIGSEQHEKVTIVDYITKGTVDEAVVEAINNKKENLQFILRDKDTITNFFEGTLDEEDGQNDESN